MQGPNDAQALMHRDRTKEKTTGKLSLPSNNISTRPEPELDGHDTKDATVRTKTDVHHMLHL